MRIFQEFKEFAVKGNVIDLAVGVIIGAAFSGVVNSLVNDIINPLLGLLVGKINFSNLVFNIGQATIKYGNFINALINFLIVGFVIFLFVKEINKLKRKPAPAEPNTKPCPYCQTNIPIKATRCPNCTSQLSSTPTS